MSKPSSKAAVWAAFLGNLGVAAAKFAAAAVTQSSAMLSEAVHSLVDTVNELMLLNGIARSERPADESHPFGYARELYFWSFVVSLTIFIIGAGVSAYEGYQRLVEPRPIEHPLVIYTVLAVSLVFEGLSWAIGVRAFRAADPQRNWWRAFRRSKDPPAFIIVFEDTAAVLGLLVAAAGTALALYTGDGRYDGAASCVIALLLTGVAALLAQESKGLLIGERADPTLSNAIMHIARSVPGVFSANSIVTVQLSPSSVIATLSLDFFDTLMAPQIEHAVAELERRIRARHPEVTSLFVKPQSVAAAKEAGGAVDQLGPDGLFGGG